MWPNEPRILANGRGDGKPGSGGPRPARPVQFRGRFGPDDE